MEKIEAAIEAEPRKPEVEEEGTCLRGGNESYVFSFDQAKLFIARNREDPRGEIEPGDYSGYATFIG